MTVTAPKFQWVWNINTLAVLAGFIAGFVAWGYTLNDMQNGRELNKQSIDRLDVRLATVETEVRRIDLQEIRITNMEKAATEAASSMKSLERTLSDLAADMKVTKEVLLRLEASQKGGRQ